jgi:hypothetical protein
MSCFPRKAERTFDDLQRLGFEGLRHVGERAANPLPGRHPHADARALDESLSADDAATVGAFADEVEYGALRGAANVLARA